MYLAANQLGFDLDIDPCDALQNESLFNKGEEAQLQTMFSLTPEGLSLVLDGLCYIFEQAAFQGVGPEPLYEQLQGAGVDDAHSKVPLHVHVFVRVCMCMCLR